MNNQQIINLLQSQVDFPINEDTLEFIEHNSGIAISSENTLLILDAIRKQHEISKLLKHSSKDFKSDEDIFIANTLKKVKSSKNSKPPLNIFAGVRALSLGLAACFCVLFFLPATQTTVTNYVVENSINTINYDEIIVTTSDVQEYLQAIEPLHASTDILRSEKFGEDKVSLYLSNISACLGC